ncbi:MAG: hypothetical protein PHW69_00505 [Elusimicrobiaceae bacterium]|nr:hypothetical protein [Elusimicrobiaceae bacterium]
MAQTGVFAYWGIGLKAGAVTASDTDFQKEVDYWASASSNYSSELTTNNGFLGAELFFETEGPSRLGVSLGLNSISEIKLEESIPNSAGTLKASAQSFPITVYWKLKAEDSSFAYRLGGGADIMSACTNMATSGSASSNINTDFKQTKLVPHLDAGAEWYISKRFALGVNIAYLFGARFDKMKGTVSGSDSQLYTVPQPVGRQIVASSSQPSGSDNYSQDYTGVRGELALRYYFGGN